MAGETLFGIPRDYLHSDGSRRDLELFAAPLRSEDGHVLGAVVVAQDVTEARAAQAERNLLTAAIEHAAEAILVTDPAGSIIYVNPAFEQITGYARASVAGQNPRLLKSGLHDEAFYERLWRTLLAGRAWHGVLCNRRRDGTQFEVDATISPVMDASGRVFAFMAVQRDLSAERALEAGLRAEIEDRQEVRSAISAFAAGNDASATAEALVDAIRSLDGLDYPLVFHLPADGGPVVHLAGDLPRYPAPGGQLDEALSSYLSRRASEGPWTHLLATEPAPGAAAELIVAEAGLTGGIFVPLSYDGRVTGVVACLTAHHDPGATLGHRMTALIELAAHAAPLLGPQMAARDDVEGRRKRLATTIAERRFRPVFQPLVGLEDRAPVGYEALTRFDDLVPPSARFAEAAALGLGLELESACLAAAVEAARSLPPGLWLAVNASAEMVTSGRLGDVLRSAGRPVVVELTEREAVTDYAAIRSAMSVLGPGVSLAVDDTGAGFSGLRHVVELRPQVVKLDEAIVRAIDGDPVRQSLVAGMVHYARTTGTRLVAEGVETEAEAATLANLGVDIGQGYLFAFPAPLEEVLADGRAA
jgi:PAS domain S-box-containing protein